MTNQDILTLTIVIAAASYAIYLLAKQTIDLFRKKDRNLACAGCASCALHTAKVLAPRNVSCSSEHAT